MIPGFSILSTTILWGGRLSAGQDMCYFIKAAEFSWIPYGFYFKVGKIW